MKFLFRFVEILAPFYKADDAGVWESALKSQLGLFADIPIESISEDRLVVDFDGTSITLHKK